MGPRKTSKNSYSKKIKNNRKGSKASKKRRNRIGVNIYTFRLDHTTSYQLYIYELSTLQANEF